MNKFALLHGPYGSAEIISEYVTALSPPIKFINVQLSYHKIFNMQIQPLHQRQCGSMLMESSST